VIGVVAVLCSVCTWNESESMCSRVSSAHDAVG